MSAPYIIPFNHQPLNVVTQNTTLTIGAGKYARVNIGSAKLPVLNSSDLFLTLSLPSTTTTTSSTSRKIAIPCNCSRFFFSWSSNITNGYLNFGDVSASVTDNQVALGNVSSYTSPLGEYQAGQVIHISTTATATITSMTFYVEPANKEIWLNDGDVLTFGAGSVTYEEYSVIS